MHVEVGDDVKGMLAKLKPEVALYVGGMGHKDKNFHKDIMVRRGFKDAADRIQELYLAHRKDEAAAAVPDEWVDTKSLVGPPARIKQRFRRLGGHAGPGRHLADRALAQPSRSRSWPTPPASTRAGEGVHSRRGIVECVGKGKADVSWSLAAGSFGSR